MNFNQVWTPTLDGIAYPPPPHLVSVRENGYKKFHVKRIDSFTIYQNQIKVPRINLPLKLKTKQTNMFCLTKNWKAKRKQDKKE